MNKDVIERLLHINHDFYHSFARPFSESRERPQPGIEQLIDYLPDSFCRILDVGCGDGRLGRFLSRQREVDYYVGVDFSEELLARAQKQSPGEFLLRDLSLRGSLDGLAHFDSVFCLATLQHIPGRENRCHLLGEMGNHLKENGLLMLSNWQFPGNKRQKRKISDWSNIGLSNDDVEQNDYLLTWRREGFGYRYVAYINSIEIEALARESGLKVLDQFRDDGREGDLNLYSILTLSGR